MLLARQIVGMWADASQAYEVHLLAEVGALKAEWMPGGCGAC